MSLKLADGLTLYVARHGQTEANRADRFSGVKDTPLTALGRQQAQNVGLVLLREIGARPALDFISSPLQRAKTTMEIARATLGLEPQGFRSDPRIQEIDLGIWDQLTDDEVTALDPAFAARRNADKWQTRIPEGESYADVAARLTHFVQGLAADSFIVSHGGASRILRALFAGLSPQEIVSHGRGRDEPQGVVYRIRGNVVERLDP